MGIQSFKNDLSQCYGKAVGRGNKIRVPYYHHGGQLDIGVNASPRQNGGKSNRRAGFIEFNKPGANINAIDQSSHLRSSLSLSTSFNTQKLLAQESQVAPSTFYEAEYITRNGSEEQKEELRNGRSKIHKVYTILRQKERLNELHRKIKSGSSFCDLDILNNLRIPLKFSDIWTFSQLDERFGQKNFPGKTFAQVVFNLLYFFTKKGEVVVDPMAGGGVVGDVCKVMGRRYFMYDINPVRRNIKNHDHGSSANY